MSEYIVDLSNVEKTSDRFKMLFTESIPLGCEIVRCRDCKHYHPEMYNNINCEWFMFDVEPDGFCKWAKRNESGDAE